MSSSNIVFPHEVIRLILSYCQTSKDYLSQSLINHQWLSEARRLKSIMKTRFARQLAVVGVRFIMWNMDGRVTVVGHGQSLQRHGLEECVQTYHRVGGPGADVYYLERHWKDGQLHGLEIVREINAIWYNEHYPKQERAADVMIGHPYDGLNAVDSMRQYRRHMIVPKDSLIPEGCDYLGKIVFQYEWISGTLEESEQLKRESSNEYDQSNFSGIYDFLHRLDIHHISEQNAVCMIQAYR